MPDNVNGFSEEQKALFGEAMALIEEGTRKYLEGRYPEVETLYKKALSIWQETTGRESQTSRRRTRPRSRGRSRFRRLRSRLRSNSPCGSCLRRTTL